MQGRGSLVLKGVLGWAHQGGTERMSEETSPGVMEGKVQAEDVPALPETSQEACGAEAAEANREEVKGAVGPGRPQGIGEEGCLCGVIAAF